MGGTPMSEEAVKIPYPPKPIGASPLDCENVGGAVIDTIPLDDVNELPELVMETIPLLLENVSIEFPEPPFSVTDAPGVAVAEPTIVGVD